MKKKYEKPNLKLLVFRTEAIATIVEGSTGVGDIPEGEEWE